MAGVGSYQLFDQNGNECISCVIYFYQAGTTTQQATYTDATGLTQNTNPVTMTTGGRANIWMLTGSLYKIVACAQNDGAFCAAGDVIFSQDQVPGGSVSGGGGGSSPFISSSSNPATTGILRLASSDTTCWRNAANSANLCWSKTSSDLLEWAGGAFGLPEIAPPSCISGVDILWADSTAHGFKGCGNGGAAVSFAIGGTDINGTSSNFVTAVHFGATQAPFSSTPPTTNQVLQWNGSQVVGATLEMVLTTGTSVSGSGTACGSAIPNCAIVVFAGPHNLIRLTTNSDTAPAGCSTTPQYGVRDLTTPVTIAVLTPTTTGILDSGALSVGMTAGHQFAIGLVTPGVGCTPAGTASVSAVYQ